MSAEGPRVAFDAAPARPGSTGVGIYVQELGRGLRVLAPERVALIGVRAGGPFDTPAERDGSAPFRGRGHLSWVQRYAERDARAAGADLVHFTNGLAPLRPTIPFVVTIQDLTFLRYPLHHPPARLMRIPLAFTAARQARAIVVPSRATERDVRRVLRVPAARIVVVGYAVREALGDRLDGTVSTDGIDVDVGATEDADATSLLVALGVRDREYILSVGGLDARKNPRRLVAALERLAPVHPELRLVIAGGAAWRRGLIRRSIERSPVARSVVLPGYVSDADLRLLLGHAGVFAYVSLGEGFGLPILEAMAAGVPVVTSRRSSMPEVAGDAAVLVDPRDVGDIARGIETALRRSRELVHAGSARAGARSWTDVASEMLDVYAWAAAR